MSPPRAVLDADIIYSRVLHELMGRLATEVRLFDLIWSENLLAEARAKLAERKGLTAEIADAWVGHMRREFPSGCVDPASAPAGVDLGSLTRDSNDRHVCALAIAGGADLLFTFDRGYLRDPLRERGVDVPDLDRYLVTQFDEQPNAIMRVVERQANVWMGGRRVDELLAAFERAGAPEFASVAGMRRQLS